jgi:hypothetical protein
MATRLLQLTEIISSQTEKIQEYFTANGLPDLSFDPTSPGDFPVPSSNTEMHEARRAVVNATQELHDLMVGPRETVRWAAWNVGYKPCCVTSQILACAYYIAYKASPLLVLILTPVCAK